MKLTNDKYKKARGGYSRLLELTCSSCGAYVTRYQKDGPGMLKRLYVDRMTEPQSEAKFLTCKSCIKELGMYFIYEKEKRPAYRLFAGAITKKIVKA
jgi:hypothetical protein